MTVGLLKDIIAERPENTALLGLDVGAKTIGLAVCDPAWQVATPLQTIKRTKFTQDIEALAKIIRDYEIKGCIIGLPLTMEGGEGPRAQSVRDFALEFAKYPQLLGANPWIALWDERLSTKVVENIVDNFVDKKKTRMRAKDSGLIDKLAAQHILQGALDYMAQQRL